MSLSIDLSIYLYLYLYISIYIFLSNYVSNCPALYLSFYIDIYRSVSVSLCSAISFSIFVSLSVSPAAHRSLSLSVLLFKLLSLQCFVTTAPGNDHEHPQGNPGSGSPAGTRRPFSLWSGMSARETREGAKWLPVTFLNAFPGSWITQIWLKSRF